MIVRNLNVMFFLLVFTSCSEDPPKPSVSPFDLTSYVRAEGSATLSRMQSLLDEASESPDGSDLCRKLDGIRQEFRANIGKQGVRPDPITVRHDTYSAEDVARDEAEMLAWEYDRGFDEITNRCWAAVKALNNNADSLPATTVLVDPAPGVIILSNQQFTLTFDQAIVAATINGRAATRSGRNWAVRLNLVEGVTSLIIRWTNRDGSTGRTEVGPYTVGLAFDNPVAAGRASPSFNADISPILTNRCAVPGCHVVGGPRGIDLRTYDRLIKGGDDGAIVIAGNAKESAVIKQIIQGRMPPAGPPLEAAQTQLIIDWINEGARNN